MKTILVTLTLISLLAVKSIACDGDTACPMNSENLTPEKRVEMATFHTQIAECLKSDKPMDECHKLMTEHMGKMGGKHSCSEHKEMKKEMHKKMHKEEMKSEAKK